LSNEESALRPLPFSIALFSVVVAASALAVPGHVSPPPPGASEAQKAWVAPGTPGSPINGEIFHAQVLLDAAGFSPGTIDGKKGASLTEAIRGFQEANGLEVTGELDNPTRQALLKNSKPSTVYVKLGPDDVKSTYVYPLPKDPEKQEGLKFLGYRNMLEKVAERYHTTPATVVALNGPDALIGPGQTLRLPNVVPQSRDYSGAQENGARLMSLLNVDGQQPHGTYIVIEKSEGVLKVYDGPVPADALDNANAAETSGNRLIAQFPVTMGSTHDPLPLGRWKVPSFAFLPPFHYQPDLFWDAKDTAKEHMLAPGPNGPVGVAWLDLTKEHYGIHGTPEPSMIGKAESHGCIRMTNWDVMRLARIMGKPGFTAIFEA
jgi:peptidoglycan hydrolase-like protein with peptidoglycan-binding domain